MKRYRSLQIFLLSLSFFVVAALQQTQTCWALPNDVIQSYEEISLILRESPYSVPQSRIKKALSRLTTAIQSKELTPYTEAQWLSSRDKAAHKLFDLDDMLSEMLLAVPFEDGLDVYGHQLASLLFAASEVRWDFSPLLKSNARHVGQFAFVMLSGAALKKKMRPEVRSRLLALENEFVRIVATADFDQFDIGPLRSGRETPSGTWTAAGARKIQVVTRYVPALLTRYRKMPRSVTDLMDDFDIDDYEDRITELYSDLINNSPIEVLKEALKDPETAHGMASISMQSYLFEILSLPELNRVAADRNVWPVDVVNDGTYVLAHRRERDLRPLEIAILRALDPQNQFRQRDAIAVEELVLIFEIQLSRGAAGAWARTLLVDSVRYAGLVRPAFEGFVNYATAHPSPLPLPELGAYLDALIRESDLEFEEMETLLKRLVPLVPESVADWLGLPKESGSTQLGLGIRERIRTSQITLPQNPAEFVGWSPSVDRIRPFLKTRDGALWVMENLLTLAHWNKEDLSPLEYWIAAAPLSDTAKAVEIQNVLFKQRPDLALHPELLTHVRGEKALTGRKIAPLKGEELIESYRTKLWVHSDGDPTGQIKLEPETSCWEYLSAKIAGPQKK